MDYIHKTLEEIESVFSQRPSEESTSLVKRVYEIRKRKLIDYNIEDLRLMIGQKQGLNYLVPLALNYLENNPFVEGDFYEGDLLISILKCKCEFWKIHLAYVERMNTVVQLILIKITEAELLDSVKESILNLIKDYNLCVSSLNNA